MPTCPFVTAALIFEMQENTRMTKLHYERRFECILEYSRDFTLDAIVPARLV